MNMNGLTMRRRGARRTFDSYARMYILDASSQAMKTINVVHYRYVQIVFLLCDFVRLQFADRLLFRILYLH